MDNPPPPQITSFILRFIHADPPSEDGSGGPAYGPAPIRGVIRNIQTDQEITFTRWQDAVDFIQRFVPIHLES